MSYITNIAMLVVTCPVIFHSIVDEPDIVEFG